MNITFISRRDASFEAEIRNKNAGLKVTSKDSGE